MLETFWKDEYKFLKYFDNDFVKLKGKIPPLSVVPWRGGEA